MKSVFQGISGGQEDTKGDGQGWEVTMQEDYSVMLQKPSSTPDSLEGCESTWDVGFCSEALTPGPSPLPLSHSPL